MLTLIGAQRVTLSIAPQDAAGNPAVVDGIPVWSATNSLLNLVPSPDGLSAVADTVGGLGTSRITVVADADLGAGVRELIGTLDVECKAGEAVTLGIIAGTPENK